MTNFERLPLFPLQAVLYPYVSLPLHIFEERYKSMVKKCVADNTPFGIVLLEPDSPPSTGNALVLHSTGTLARIEQSERLPDGRYNISARGEQRFIIEEVFQEEEYLTARVRPRWEMTDDPIDVQPFFDTAGRLFQEYVEALYGTAQLSQLQLPFDASFLSYAISATLQIELSEKQLLLAADSPKQRLELGVQLLKRELSKLGDLAELETELNPDSESGRTISRLDPSDSHTYFSRS